jgi:CxxC motif-containing protein (DUF1111 family)
MPPFFAGILPSALSACVAAAMIAPLVLPCGKQAIAIQEFAELRKGRDLFRKDFSRADNAEGEPLLGPVFNETSCISCHDMGGIGGAGAGRFDFQILTVMPPRGRMSEHKFRQFREEMESLHPGFRSASSVIFHQHARSEGYAAWRDGILGLLEDKSGKAYSPRERKERLVALQNQGMVWRIPREEGFGVMVTHRNSPALFGAGLIDSIPDTVIEQAARIQQRSTGPVKGQVSRLKSPDTNTELVGKFGWRGNIASLEDFVRAACVNELGLELEGMTTAVDPAEQNANLAHLANRDKREAVAELDESDVRALARFVRSLAPPKEVQPVSDRHREVIGLGRVLFRNMGCAQCHLPEMGNVNGIYSDLLLHDMGTSLEDPMPAPGLPLFDRIKTGETTMFAGYGGGRITLDQFVDRPRNEPFRSWRTPPLWGVAGSAPYMHDGRADNLHQAILAHDGEARESARRYAELVERDQSSLIEFLTTLGVPGE